MQKVTIIAIVCAAAVASIITASYAFYYSSQISSHQQQSSGQDLTITTIIKGVGPVEPEQKSNFPTTDINKNITTYKNPKMIGNAGSTSNNSANKIWAETEKVQINEAGFLKAPELSGISGYINTDGPIKLSDFQGKVVLVDFWTFDCINCIHTIPYLVKWNELYSNKGLKIIGVHTPEFEFEKDYNNVKEAVQKYGIKFPVVQDNNYSTWNAYSNHYWPRFYLVDAQGYIRYSHVGEGQYDVTETTIKQLLCELPAGAT